MLGDDARSAHAPRLAARRRACRTLGLESALNLQRISLLSLLVDDVPGAIDFYGRALGWEPAQRHGDGLAFYQANGFVLSIWERSGWAEEGLAIEPPTYSCFSLNLATREEADAVVRTWESAGGAVAQQPQETYWGGYSGYVRDPWGNLIEIAVNDGFTLTEDGRTLIG